MSTTDKLKGAVMNRPQAAPKAAASVMSLLSSDKFKSQLAMTLPKSLTPERMSRIVMTELKRTPKLLDCDQVSFFAAVLQCASLGIEPGSTLGLAYLLPYGQKAQNGKPTCQLILGYRGMIELARRSGQISTIYAYCVHERDHFEYRLGLDPTIDHVPATGADPGPTIAVYAVAKLKDGGFQFEVMSRAEVEKIRKRSKAGNSGPWVTDFDEMAKKTVIRRLFKYLPVSIEAAHAAVVDERQEQEGAGMEMSDFLEGEYIEKGGEIPDIKPTKEGSSHEPALAEEPAQQEGAEKLVDPAPTQAASQGEPADPWLDSFNNAQQRP